MNVLRLVSRTLRTSIEAGVEQVVQAWMTDWCPTPSPFAVRSRSARAVASQPSVIAARAASPAAPGSIWIGATGKAWDNIILGDTTRCPRDGFLADVRERAVDSLLERLADLLGLQRVDVRQITVLPPLASKGPAELIVVEVEVAGNVLTLLVEPEVAGRLPRRELRRDTRRLVPRREAVSNKVAQASVRIDLGEYSLKQLGALAPGAVLSSTTPLTQPFQLQIGDTVALHVMLGRRNRVKAATIISQQR